MPIQEVPRRIARKVIDNLRKRGLLGFPVASTFSERGDQLASGNAGALVYKTTEGELLTVLKQPSEDKPNGRITLAYPESLQDTINREIHSVADPEE